MKTIGFFLVAALAVPARASSALKPPLHGIVSMGDTSFNHDGSVPNNSLGHLYARPGVFDGVVINVTWAQFEPVRGSLDPTAIDQAALARQLKPDLVIVDHEIPGGDDASVYEALRRFAKMHRLPVLFISASRRALPLKRIVEKDPRTRFLNKPVRPQMLVDVVHELLDTPRSAAAILVAKPSVLLVEDDPAMLQLVRSFLAEDYQILSAASLEEARAKIFDQRPDLILLDRELPDGDGLELCKQLRQTPVAPNVPVIFVTARRGDVEKTVGTMMGADDYIVKPFQPDELRRKIQQCLRRSRPRSPDDSR